MSSKQPKLLIIDDDEALQMAYKIAFEQAGFVVVQADNGQSALKAVTNDVDVMLVDMIMPYMGGLEFLQEYQPKKHPKTVVIVLTNSQVPEDTEASVRELGAVDYLKKSDFTPVQLVEEIRQHLNPAT